MFYNYSYINNIMAIEINRPDTFQTRFFQSFVNMTQLSGNTLFPAVTTLQIHATNNEPLSSYTIYDQWALRTYNQPK